MQTNVLISSLIPHLASRNSDQNTLRDELILPGGAQKPGPCPQEKQVIPLP